MYENEEERELREALEPVRQYFSGKEVTTNTVLAAYLRSVGLPAFGEAWETAKRAVGDGYNFAHATRVAATINDRPAVTAPVGSAFQPRHSLRWFPKQFGPGDIDGVGAKRLLGTPNIDPASVLVRETAQNSWDARGVSPSIDFTINLRLLDRSLVERLRSRVFTGDPPGTGLAELLCGESIWALEVSDRGTVGLGGPVRNDLAVESGIDRNFIDLVFNIGAPRDVHLGGGTYGFGKTITYLLSSVGTVLIWSRCEGTSGQEDRIIGSAIGEAFNMSGSRYTGRHWWGNVITTENRIEPVLGNLAGEIGSAVFAKRFASGATGTSILILDPQLGGVTPEDNVQALVDAVTWNLWPKLIADSSGRSLMNISVQLNGKPITLPDIQQHPVLSGYAECLNAVRTAEAKTATGSFGQRYPVECQEVWCERPRTLLGHLALARYPAPRQTMRPAHSVALMRQAELIVKYFDRRELDVEGFQWAAVFKAAVEVDDSFSMAEPPAHDDWVPQAIEDRRRRREVNVALKRVKEIADQFLIPRVYSNADASDVPVSTATLGDMLADLLSGQQGSAPTLVVLRGAEGLGATIVPTQDDDPPARDVIPPTSKGGGKEPGTPTRTADPGGRDRGKGPRPKAEVTGLNRIPSLTPGWSRTLVQVQLSTTSPPGTVVNVAVRIAIDGGSIEDGNFVAIVGWKDEHGGAYDAHPLAFAPGDTHEFVYESRSDLAIDIDIKLGTS